MIIASNTNIDNGLENNKQYEEIIRYVQQCKNDPYWFRLGVEQAILNNIHYADHWMELRHVPSSSRELRINATDIIRDYVELCGWETTKKEWTYEDEVNELSNLAYDFSWLHEFWEEVPLLKKVYVKGTYEYWEECLSSNQDLATPVMKKYEYETQLFSILVLFDYKFDGWTSEKKEVLDSLYKEYWETLNKFFKDKNCRFHFGLTSSVFGCNRIRVLVRINKPNFQ